MYWARKKTAQNSDAITRKIAPLPAAKARERKKPSGTIGAGARHSQPTNSAEQRGAGGQGAGHLGAAPAGGVAAHQAPHHAEHAGRDERRAPGGRAAGGAVALAHPDGRDRRQHQPDRDVEPEDPVPVEALRDGAADQRPAGDGQAGHGEEDPEGGAAALGRIGGADERERQRHHRGGADALDGAGGDQRAGGRRQRARGGRGGEQRDAARERAAAADAVADDRGGHEQHGERQVERVDGPLELREGRAEVLADRGEGRRDDERVERGHEARDRRDRQHDAGAAADGGWAGHLCLPVVFPIRSGPRAGSIAAQAAAGPGAMRATSAGSRNATTSATRPSAASVSTSTACGAHRPSGPGALAMKASWPLCATGVVRQRRPSAKGRASRNARMSSRPRYQVGVGGMA